MKKELHNYCTPTLGFAAFSGTGKTTLLRNVIPLLIKSGLRLAIIKHAHHEFDIDTPGKDSYELRKAGARQVLVASRNRRALMVETPDNSQDPALTELILQLDQQSIDLILVEGFKNESFNKIELHRVSLQHPLLYPHDASIVAIACDENLESSASIPYLDINNAQQIADFIIKYYQENSNAK